MPNIVDLTPGDEHLDLRRLADIYEATLKLHNGYANRRRSKEQGADEAPGSTPLKQRGRDDYLDAMTLALAISRNRMEAEAPNHPVYPWIMGVPGLAKGLICRVIGLIPMNGPNCLACGGVLRDHYDVMACRGGPTRKPKGDDAAADPAERRPAAPARRGCKQAPVEATKSGDSYKCRNCGGRAEHVRHVMACENCHLSGSDFPSFSRLRVFSGHCPGRNKLVKNEKACFSGRLRVACHVAYTSLLKAVPLVQGKPWAPKKFYAEIYHNWRITYAERDGIGNAGTKYMEKHGVDPARFQHYKGKRAGGNHPWSDGHQSNAAKYKLMDVFLSHAWLYWRETKGWPARELYVHERLGHQMHYDLADFSSPALAERKIKKAQAELRKAENLSRTMPRPVAPPAEDRDEDVPEDYDENFTTEDGLSENEDE